MKPSISKRGSLIVGIILLVIVVGMEAAQWVLLLKGQEVRWFNVFSSTLELLILTAAFIYSVIVLWRER